MDTNGYELGILDVMAHSSEVVDRVLREGRTITVTRNGEPVVDIVPSFAKHAARMSTSEALAALEELRKKVAPISFGEIRAIADEARNRRPNP